jgi:DNA primase
VVKQFRLGYDPFSNRMTLPVRDHRGRILGVSYRRLDDQRPKYLDPKGYPKGRYL